MPQAAATDLVLWGTYCVRPGGPGIDGMEGGSKRAFPRGKLTPRAWLPTPYPEAISMLPLKRTWDRAPSSHQGWLVPELRKHFSATEVSPLL